MKHLKVFESFEDTNKYLIELGSANSHGVNRESDERTKKSAEEWWSMLGYVYKLDFSKRYNSLSNEDLTKCISNNFRDLPSIRFKKEYDGLKTIELNKYLSYFKNYLKIDQKLEFLEVLEEYGFLIINQSYIYKIVDASEIDENINNVRDIILSASDHML